jgi:hypothetical protein
MLFGLPRFAHRPARRMHGSLGSCAWQRLWNSGQLHAHEWLHWLCWLLGFCTMH